MRVRREGEWLVAELGAPHRVASWAVVGGGLETAEVVAWRRVTNAELGVEADPAALLRGWLDGAGLGGAVGMLTAANLDTFEEARCVDGDVVAHAVVTAGLSNALRVGDPPGEPRVGTINVLVVLSVPVTEAGLLEAMSIAVEARTVAVLEAAVRSTASTGIASGTGTDCVVVAAPVGGDAVAYAGKHTAVGALIGAAVLDATARGVAAWKGRWGRVS